jgi:hypothetical protein
MPRLTKKQRALITEIKDLMPTLSLNPDEIATLEDSAERSARLDLAKDQIVRSMVILKYVLMDEFLSGIMCWHYFGKKRGLGNSRQFLAEGVPQTKDFRRF